VNGAAGTPCARPWVFGKNQLHKISGIGGTSEEGGFNFLANETRGDRHVCRVVGGQQATAPTLPSHI
jgi:hypothetical protein